MKQLPFGMRGLSAPSVEALDRRGLLGELEVWKRMKDPHANAAEGPRRQMGHFAGIPFVAGNIDRARWGYRLPTSTAPSLISEMQELETVLGRRAEALGVEIRRGSAVTGLDEAADEICVAAGDQTFRGRWLVGCDGGRSVVRKLGKFEFAGTEPEFTGYTTRVSLADPEKLKPGRNLTARGMYLQSQPGYVIIQDFDGGAFHDAGRPITPEHLQEVLRRVSATDVTVSALHLASTWTDRSRQVTAYRKGRVLLAGDAAHIHSPLGGQGLNLGLGDAMNLGWKLAATVRGEAPEGLLDSYETERYGVGAQVLDWSRAQVLAMRPEPAARALHEILRDLMETRDGATYFAERVWGLSAPSQSEGAHPLLGQSVPNFEFDDGTSVAEWMRDGSGLLLDFAGSASLESLVQEGKGRIKYVRARARVSFGLQALLIRPDGVIGWACDTELDEASVRCAFVRWFGLRSTKRDM